MSDDTGRPGSDIPTGNGDFVKTRELYGMERRLSAVIQRSVEKVRDECVDREADKSRHTAIAFRFNSVELCVKDNTEMSRSLAFKVGGAAGGIAVLSNIVMYLLTR